MPHTELITDRAALTALRPTWNALAQEDPATCLGLDGSSTIEWFWAVQDALDDPAQARTVCVRSGPGGEVLGLFPTTIVGRQMAGLRLMTSTGEIGGRNGLLVARQDPAIVLAWLRSLAAHFGPWASFEIRLVCGSPSESLMKQACRQGGYRMVPGEPYDSPYFPLEADDKAFMAHVSKSLRQNLRTSVNRYRGQFDISYRDYLRGDQADELLEVMMAIERQSWKHTGGDALTKSERQQRFHRALFQHGLPAGRVVAKVACANGEPIAFNVGVVHQGVFSCLKHSQVEAHEKYSPSYLLNLELINTLRAMGVRTYDFKGAVNPHKTRWSDQTRTYTRRPWTIYPPTLRGWVQWQRQQLAATVARLRATRAPAATPEAPAAAAGQAGPATCTPSPAEAAAPNAAPAQTEENRS